MGKGKKRKTVLLEPESLILSMTERLQLALQSITPLVGQETARGSEVTLRREQLEIFSDFVDFVRGFLLEGQSPMGRIILPPRTGKTVVAGHIIIATGLTATFIVPTINLVQQVAEELQEQLPSVPIGRYYGEEKKLVSHGVNVATYQTLHNVYKVEGRFPEPIAKSALIFTDEGHTSMTLYRQGFLKGGFDPAALKIALTATPDYNEDRRLCNFYPELIHEITVWEALKLELFAETRFWLMEVDRDASWVKMRVGDYDESALARVMSDKLFFAAATHIRYSQEENGRAALICCKTVTQAEACLKYMRDHRPAGTPRPQLIVGTTPKNQRKKIMRRFDKGRIDTIINVGVLVQGWDAPRCKLEIDIAPSCSLVRGQQKFFRPMTKWKDEEAHIYMLVPQNLPQPPVLPLEVIFDNESDEYLAGELFSSKLSKGAAPNERRQGGCQIPLIAGVHSRQRILFANRLAQTGLDPNNIDQVRRVIRSHPEFEAERPWSYPGFCHLYFEHDLFRGSGKQLLRLLGIKPSRENYTLFMVKIFPESGSELYLNYPDSHSSGYDSITSDAYLIAMLSGKIPHRRRDEKAAQQAWRALGGNPDTGDISLPAHGSDLLFLPGKIRQALLQLTPRQEYIVRQYILAERRAEDIAREIGITDKGIHQAIHSAMVILRRLDKIRDRKGGGLKDFL